jgi:hypothetical protein
MVCQRCIVRDISQLYSFPYFVISNTGYGFDPFTHTYYWRLAAHAPFYTDTMVLTCTCPRSQRLLLE